MKRLSVAAVVLVLFGIGAWVATTGDAWGDPPQKAVAADTQMKVEKKTAMEGTEKGKVHYVVFVQFDDEDPGDPGKIWPGHVVPEDRHVKEGGWLGLANLCQEPIRITFKGAFFQNTEKTSFDLAAGEVVRLRLKDHVRLAREDPKATYKVESLKAFKALPTPNLFVP